MPARRDGWPPRWLSGTNPRARSDGPTVASFIEACCRVTKDTIAGPAGSPLALRPWQLKLLHALYVRRPDGRLKHRQALIGMPRKNGKSALGAGIALYGLYSGGQGNEVYSCAGDRDQARIVFSMAKRMVELESDLADITKVYRDALEDRTTGSVYRVLSAEAYTKEGLNPTLVVFDEVHVQPNDELWNVMNLGSGTRADPMCLGITTAGVRTDTLGRDTLCYRLYQHGQQVARGELDDPTFFFAWWEPRLGAVADHRDPKVWKESNPAYGDLIDPEDFASVVVRTPENEFRTKRTNVFTTAVDHALPYGAWDACAAPRDLHGDVVLMVDGAWVGDCTAIVGCDTSGYVFQVGLWESDGSEGWRVPINDVKARIVETCRSLPVIEVAFDPFRWQQTMADLLEEGLPVTEFHTNQPARIVPAWKRFYDAVMDKQLAHDGTPELARHLDNVVLKYDHNGARPVKEHKMSGRHIDLAICAVGAYDRAMSYEPVGATNLW